MYTCILHFRQSILYIKYIQSIILLNHTRHVIYQITYEIIDDIYEIREGKKNYS